MISSCMCTIFCLLTFLMISLQSEEVSPSSFFSNLCSTKDCPRVKDFMPSFTDLKEIGKVLTYHQARISRIFLFALESVALTDVASSAIRMSDNIEFRIAMNYEGSLLFKHTSWILLAAWVFNISNGMHDSLLYEILLVLLVSAWILASFIDVNYFNKENNVERTIDYSGFRYIKDITWFQTDIDVVSMIISILLYSQLKTAPSIVYPDEIPLSQAVLPPRVHHVMLKLLSVITSEFDWDLDSLRLESDSSSETERLEFTAEAVLILFVCISAIRFKNNFKVCINYMDLLRLITWTPQMIPAEQRHDRRNYRRDLPFHWADNPDADMGDVQILGVAEVLGN